MKTTLAGEDIELNFTFKRVDAIEKDIGSLYGYPTKCVNKSVTASDIVSIYYNAQEAAYSKEKIFEKILADGLINHITLTYDIIMRLSVGEKLTKQLEEAKDLEEANGSEKK